MLFTVPDKECNIKEITLNNKENMVIDSLIKEYRSLTNVDDRLIYVSSLSLSDKNKLYENMSINEINHYKKIASDFIENRFKDVQIHLELLDYLLKNPRKVMYKILSTKYKNIDLSKSIYAIADIINVVDDSKFSKDYSSPYFNINAQKHYCICKDYWSKIWWDTGIYLLSKKANNENSSSLYHLNCNKITTLSKIRRYLHLLKITDFTKRYKV